jgi:hypothetical protein
VTGPKRATVVVGAASVAALFVGQALWPEAWLYRGETAEAVRLRIGGATKLLLLTLAWHEARLCARSLPPGNPARAAWRSFAGGLLLYAVGQLILSFYQVVLGESPYPSPGDIFFMAAYPALVWGAIGFIRAYREAGYPVGSPREHAAIGLGLGTLFAALGFFLLRPVLAQPGPLLERIVTAAYPTFDFVLLVPILILVRIAAPFRGGAIFRAWALVLSGIVALCAGDILYAYFAVLGRTELGPLVDAIFVLAYLGLVLGTAEQRQLLSA